MLNAAMLFLFMIAGKYNRFLFGIYYAVRAINILPAVFLTVVIISTKNAGDGPTFNSKVKLSSAMILLSLDVFPDGFWQLVLGTKCIFYFGNWVNIIMILKLVGMFFLFSFIRQEFNRNMEECIWLTVSQIQDSFDIRRF